MSFFILFNFPILSIIFYTPNPLIKSKSIFKLTLYELNLFKNAATFSTYSYVILISKYKDLNLGKQKIDSNKF